MEQMTMIFNDYNITKLVRLIELFGGIGSQAMALTNLGVNFEHHIYCDFDKHSVKSYNAIFGTDFTPTDITKLTGEDLKIVETDKYEYIMTYSFPCQDLSLAGKGAGMNKGDNTRSGLLWEVERLLKETKELPQILLMENVPQVKGKKNLHNFNKWKEFLESLGYSNFVQNLIATDYGIPQTRNRTFMVSILGEHNYTFPKPFKLEKKLRDLLETDVDEKYYLSDKKIESISNWKSYQKPLKDIDKEKLLAPTLTARGAGEEHAGMILINENTLKRNLCNKLIEKDVVDEGDIINVSYSNARLKELESGQNVTKLNTVDNTVSPTILTSVATLGVVVKERTAAEKRCDFLIENDLVEEMDVIKHSYLANRLDDDGARLVESNDTMQTLTSRVDIIGVVVKKDTKNYIENDLGVVVKDLRIRKITPLESWRLMGFDDEDFYKAEAVNSNAQLYKQAGNSIVVDVLENIFKQLFDIERKL